MIPLQNLVGETAWQVRRASDKLAPYALWNSPKSHSEVIVRISVPHKKPFVDHLIRKCLFAKFPESMCQNIILKITTAIKF
jgi:hypothetical protein